MSLSPDERKAAARTAYEAINRKDPSLLEGHPGFWQSRQIIPLMLAGFPDLSSTVEQQTIDGEWVTTRSTMRGTHQGEFMGVAPTGKRIELMHISLDQINDDGQVVEHLGVSDWVRALITFGLIPAPEALLKQKEASA
jgi:predicted ester cyclase